MARANVSDVHLFRIIYDYSIFSTIAIPLTPYNLGCINYRLTGIKMNTVISSVHLKAKSLSFLWIFTALMFIQLIL